MLARPRKTLPSRVREDPRRDVLLVALTGYVRDEDRRRSAAAGFDHHMVKPVDVEALVALLARRVSGRRKLPAVEGPG